VPPCRRLATGPLHLLVDSTGLKLGGAVEWLVEKHGTSRRRSWRKLHIGLDGESGEIVAIELTKKESDDDARTAALSFSRTSRCASRSVCLTGASTLGPGGVCRKILFFKRESLGAFFLICATDCYSGVCQRGELSVPHTRFFAACVSWFTHDDAEHL
jgi:hypothetical protein